jgi:hypothetical protein
LRFLLPPGGFEGETMGLYSRTSQFRPWGFVMPFDHQRLF